MDSGFNDQYIVIAGGFRGMGLELAKLLLADKAKVFLIGYPSEREFAEKALSQYEDWVTFFSGDLSKPDILQLAEKSIKEWCGGKLHHLTIYLGSGKTPFGYNFSLDHWKQVFDVNFFSPIAVVQALCSLMFHGEGHPSITLTGAIAGVERVRAPMTYSIAKTSLIAYANHLADALVEKDVRVNIVSPGNVFYKGGRWEEIVAEKGDEIQKFLNGSVGMKRLGNSEELASVFYNVMSPKNSFMTGQNIIADGLQTRHVF